MGVARPLAPVGSVSEEPNLLLPRLRPLELSEVSGLAEPQPQPLQLGEHRHQLLEGSELR